MGGTVTPPCSPSLVFSNFHLFGPLKEAQGKKKNLESIKLNVLCNDGWTSNHKLF